jgi:hypothetical protein
MSIDFAALTERSVYLTTDLSPDALRPKRIRRRRLLGRGQSIRIRLAPLGTEGSDLPALFIDGELVAYMGYPESGEWHSVEGEWWGNGLDIRTETRP